MKSLKNQTARSLIVCILLLLLPGNIHAWEPNTKDLDAAIKSGDLTAYFKNISAWLDRKTPADPGKISKAAMVALIKEPVFRNTLDQRQFIAGHGLGNIKAFAAGKAKREFLAWILKSTKIMDLYMEAAANTSGDMKGMSMGALKRWHTLYAEDPESRDGVYLKLAMASALWPPGGKCTYRSTEHVQWLPRYKNFKAAHKRKELVPSFDHLLVNDYGRVISSTAADVDLDWGRKMINTWRPDLREKEQIPKIVSEVWRRFSPFPFSNGYITVMEGGGKCGPRGAFGAFICQAMGIPAITVGQPKHFCFAARAHYPQEEPQYGSVWKVYQGRGWHVSDCGGNTWGPQFLARMTREYRTEERSTIGHLKWLAAALSSKERAGAVLAVAGKIPKHVNTSKPLGVPATGVDVVTAWPFNAKPDKTSELDAFAAPQNDADDYGSCVRGFIHPPKTGKYEFFIASDDDSQLFLSAGDNPGNKIQIAYVNGWVEPGQFDEYPAQKSRPIRLEAGKRYYIEALHRDGTGGDHLAVAWSGPGVEKGVIKGAYLSSYPSGAKGKISRQVWLNLSNPRSKPEPRPEAPFKTAPGVIHVEAETFTGKSQHVYVYNCYTGGKQVNFHKRIQNSWVDYVIDVPKAGTYKMAVMLAAANRNLVLNVTCGTEKLGAIKIPGTKAMWQKMSPVDIKLKAGKQTLRISAPFQRGIALRWFELKAKKAKE